MNHVYLRGLSIFGSGLLFFWIQIASASGWEESRLCSSRGLAELIPEFGVDLNDQLIVPDPPAVHPRVMHIGIEGAER